MVSLLSDVKPLKEYLNDKKEMIEIMFSCIEENQLKKMIPDVLKDARLEDIKAECLVELLGMSKKRITGILEGRELDESSEDSLELSDLSDISDDDSIIKDERTPEKNTRKKESKESKGKGSKKVRKSSTSDSDREEVRVKKKKMKKTVEESPVKEAVPKKSKAHAGKKSKTTESSKEEKKQESTVADIQDDIIIPPEEKEGKNLLEILELEMRARAIRSLLQREEKKNKETSEPKPSTSTAIDTVEPEDNDPDAVILIDETADQIDLTKDESDPEESTNSKNKEDKPTTSQVRNYRSNQDQSAKTSSKDPEKPPNEVINPSDKPDSNKAEVVPKNWTERWLESSDVQKVMKTSKVLTNLKKRMISVNKQKSLADEKTIEEPKEKMSIEGTVSEYSQLPSKLLDQNNTEPTEMENQPKDESNSLDNSRDIESTVETFISKDEMLTITECESSEIKDISKTVINNGRNIPNLGDSSVKITDSSNNVNPSDLEGESAEQLESNKDNEENSNLSSR